MFLSDRDLWWAIKHGHLVITTTSKQPLQIGPTSIDLHLDSVEQAKVWDIPKFRQRSKTLGHGDVPELPIGDFDYKTVAGEFQRKPTMIRRGETTTERVFRRGDSIIVLPGGFVLWQTKEWVGTPEEGAQLICFVDGKSRA